MLWFEYDGPNNERVTDPDVEMGFIRALPGGNEGQ